MSRLGCRDERPSRMSPSVREDWLLWRMRYVWTFPAAPRSGRVQRVRSIRGSGVFRKPIALAGSGATDLVEALTNCQEAWRLRCSGSGSGQLPVQRPGNAVLVSGSLAPLGRPEVRDGSEPRYYLSKPRRTLFWRPWPTWEGRGGALKTFRLKCTATWGWLSPRSAPGRAGSVALSPGWAESCSPDSDVRLGKNEPMITRPAGLPGGARDAAFGNG